MKQLVLIEWVDITKHNTGWIPQENVIENMTFMNCRSVGYVVAHDEERVVLSQTVTDDKITDPLVIPQKVIKSIFVLKKAFKVPQKRRRLLK